MGERNIIACGMYAFNQPLRQAWQDLFEHFKWPGDSAPNGSIDLRFDGLDSMDTASLLFGHTCGYPLMTQLFDSYTPFCVPLFDAPGIDGIRYSSRFIVPAESGLKSLQDCRGAVVAINGLDSNSGMNVLRYELARTGASGKFFRKVILSGGHLASVEAVAGGTAQLAAIDCVSFQLIEDQDAALAAAVDTIGFSAHSCGLPFVVANEFAAAEVHAGLLKALDQAFDKLSPRSRQRLRLRGFAAVDLADYQSICEMQNFAISSAYAEIK